MVVEPVHTPNRNASGLPRPWPLLGHFPAYGRDPLGFVSRVAAFDGVVPIRMGPFRVLMISAPAAIEEVLVSRHRDFRKSRVGQRVAVVTGEGLVLAEGELWRRHRRAVQPAFHRERISAWADLMVAETEATVARWPTRGTVDVYDEMMALTLRIVSRSLLASDVSEDDIEAVATSMEGLNDHFASRFNGLRYFIPDALPTPGNRRMRAAVRRLDTIIYRLIAENREGERRGGDAVSMLLDARLEDGRALSDREVRDEVMTLFLAGHETTALALTFALYLLGRDPSAADWLMAELGHLPSDRSLTLADVPHLARTEAVVYETLRLYPPAYALSREAVRPTSIGGRPVSKGMIAFLSVWAAHRDAEHFPDPGAFHPERWLDGLAKRLPRGAYVPFAEGPRKCLGASFAMQEAILALATIMSRVKFAPTSTIEPRLQPAVTLRPAEPILLEVATR